MGRKEILLKEYEICQQDSDSMISTHWTVVGIFIGISTGALAWATNGIISSNIQVEDSTKFLVLAVGSGIIALHVLLILWLNRVNYLVGVNNFRMREIETYLGMSKTTMVWALSHWNRLACGERLRLIELHRPWHFWQRRQKILVPFCFYWCKPDGSIIIKVVYSILVGLWIVLIILWFCPPIRQILIN